MNSERRVLLGAGLTLSSWPAWATANHSEAARLLRAALADLPARGFEVWVTHNFVIADLTAVSTASGEGVVLGTGEGGAVRVLARLPAL